MRKIKNENIILASIKDQGAILSAIIAMCVVLAITTQGLFFSNANIANLLNSFTTNCVLAFAMTGILIVGEIDLSVGSWIALSGVSLCMLLNAGVDFVVALLIVLIGGALAGGIVGCIFVYTGMPSFVVTLAMQMIVRGIAELICDGTRVSSANEQLYLLSSMRILGIPLPTILAFVICLILTIVLSRTIFGKHMYAIGGNRNAAIYSGIKTKKIIVITTMITTALSCFAGILVASKVTSGQPTAGVGYEGNAIAAAVLGGVAFTGGSGTYVGALLGALVIGIMSNGLNLLEINTYWQTIIKGIIIVLAVLIDTIKKKKQA